MLLHLLQASLNEKFSTQEVSSESGIYFEQLGTVKTYHTSWKLITYVNLTTYNDDYNMINDIVKEIPRFCNNLITPTTCKANLNNILQILEDINEYHINWFIPKENKFTRNKRGLLNIIGNIQKSLFGVLDENDALLYLEEFNRQREHDIIQDTIINKQTTLFQSVLNMMNSTLKNQGHTINNLLLRIVRLDGDYIRLKNQVIMNELFNDITIELLQFQNKQRLLVEAISVGQNNPNNPNLIPPKIFYNELRKIKNSITASNLDLPLALDQNSIAMFYHISTAEARIINNQLIISFTLPLINTKEFILYKSTSLPYKIMNDLYGYIIPVHDYVALDKFKDFYIPITNSELEDCYQIDNENLICKETFPIMYARHTKICEINALRQELKSDNCEVRVSNITSEIWLHLKQPNTYIYTFPKPQTIYISCDNVTETKTLSNTGIIHVEPGCVIKSDSLIITAFQIITTTLYRNIKTSMNFQNKIMNFMLNITNETIKKFKIPEINYPSIIEPGQNQELEAMSVSLNEIRKLEHELTNHITPIDFQSNISFLTYITYITIIVVIIVIIRYIYKKQKKIRINRLNKLINLKKEAISPPIIFSKANITSHPNILELLTQEDTPDSIVVDTN